MANQEERRTRNPFKRIWKRWIRMKALRKYEDEISERMMILRYQELKFKAMEYKTTIREQRACWREKDIEFREWKIQGTDTEFEQKEQGFIDLHKNLTVQEKRCMAQEREFGKREQEIKEMEQNIKEWEKEMEELLERELAMLPLLAVRKRVVLEELKERSTAPAPEKNTI